VCENLPILVFDEVMPMPNETAEKPLSLDIDRTGGAPVVRLHGRLVAGVGGYLYAEVHQLIPGNRQIVLDLAGLTHLDSMGIGTLVRLYVSARSVGCELELANLGKQVQRILGTTGLLSVFKVIGEHGIKMG
jgi:anti-sigma B factor antagonist